MLASLQEFSKYAAQLGTLLSSKELITADALCEKAFDDLRTYERPDFRQLLLKFTSAFLKLFVNCPSALAEGLTKKLLSLLREMQKLRSSQKQKWDCLVPALLQTADKYYIRPFCQAQTEKSANMPGYLQQILGYGMKGGSSLREVLGLLRKAVQREKEWSNKVYNPTQWLFEAYKNEISGYLKEEEPAERKRQYLKLLTVQQLLQTAKGKFEKQIKLLLNQNLQTYLAQNQSNASQILGLFLYMELREDRIDFGYAQQNGKELRLPFGNRALQCVLGHALVREFIEIGEGRGSLMKIKKLLLLSSCQMDYSAKFQASGLSSKELTLWVLKMSQRLQIYRRQFGKSFSCRQVVTVFMAEKSNQQQYLAIFTALPQIIYKLRQSSVGNEELALALTLLCWSISTFDVQEQILQTQADKFLCKSLKAILVQINRDSYVKSQSFWKELYLSFDFQLSFRSFIYQLFQLQEPQPSRADQLRQTFSKLPCSYAEYDQTAISQLKALFNTQSNITQTLVDLTSIAFLSVRQAPSVKKINSHSELTNLSLVFYQKLRIRSNKPQQSQEPCLSFQTTSKGRQTQKAVSMLWCLYQKQDQLGLKQRKQDQEKTVVSSVRKYLSLQFGKLNDILIKKWVLNRDYLSLWCMLLCAYKIKSVCQQLAKCDIAVRELLTLFRVEPGVAKHLVEYLYTKDKYKFRLHLFNAQQLNQLFLLESAVPSLLCKPM